MNSSKPAQREYSIDLLRILSMLMIVSLHSLSHGGIITLAGDVNVYGIYFHCVYSLCILSVNVYVLISGYFLINQIFRTSKLLKLIAETLFYAWLIVGVRVLMHDTPGMGDVFKSILPISFNFYWFISAYIIMFILSPVINKAVLMLNQRQHLSLIIVSVLVFSLWSDIIPFSAPMGLSGRGTDVVWFIVLYLIGAYIRRYVGVVDKKKSLGGALLCCSLLVITWLAIIGILSVRDMGLDRDHYVFASNFYFKYNSLLSLGGSVCLFLFFRNMTVNGFWGTRVIKFIAPLTLGIYLIHDNPLVREYVWSGLIKIEELTPVLPLYVMIYVLFVFIAGIFIDVIRKYILCAYTNTKIYKGLLERIDLKTESIFEKCLNKYINQNSNF